LPDPPIYPRGIVIVANFGNRLRRRRDALEVTESALGILIDRANDCLLLAVDRDFVDALRRTQYARCDADDRDNNNDPNRDEQTDARLFRTRSVRLRGGLYRRRRQHIAT
jgi:hypothetical protein